MFNYRQKVRVESHLHKCEEKDIHLLADSRLLRNCNRLLLAESIPDGALGRNISLVCLRFFCVVIAKFMHLTLRLL